MCVCACVWVGGCVCEAQSMDVTVLDFIGHLNVQTGTLIIRNAKEPLLLEKDS